MDKKSLFTRIYEQYLLVSRRKTSHAGILYGIVCSFLASILIAGGFLTGLDDYLTTIIYQSSYSEPKPQAKVFIAKKDQATSELLGKNPDRQEFAAIFDLLGKTQKVKRRGPGKARPFTFFTFRLGYFNDLDMPIVRNSMLDMQGVTVKILDSIEADPQQSGYSSLVRIDSMIFTPSAGNVFRSLAGGRGGFLLPTLGLWSEEEEFGLVNLDSCFEENQRRLEAGQKPLYPDMRSLRASAEQSQKAAQDLFDRWENFFSNLVRSQFSANIELFPDAKEDEGTVLKFKLVSRFEPLPPEYYVGPASVIAFDFILQGRKSEKVDGALKKAIDEAESEVILAAHTKLEEEYEIDDVSYQLSSGAEDITSFQKKNLVTRLIMPDKHFLSENVRLGLIDMSAGNKSFVNQVPMFSFLPKQNRLEPSFSLITAMAALDSGTEKPEKSYVDAMYKELERICPMVASGTFYGPMVILDRVLPVDKYGRLFIKYLGSTQKNRYKRPAIPSVSFFECFSEDHLKKFSTDASPQAKNRLARAHRRTLDDGGGKEGKVVLAGPFELSDFDFYPTPMSMRTPYTIQSEPLMGIEIHANSVLNILEKCYLKHPSNSHTIFALIVTALILGILLDFLSPLTGGLVTLAFMYGIGWYASYSYNELGQVFYFSALVICYPVIWCLATLTNYIRQRVRAQNTKNMFSRFVAADVVQYMLENPELVKPGGQKVELTIFFSDVAGFTSISEALTPEELVVLLNEYLGAMTDLLFEYGGTLDKFIGDAVMAFWNYPKEQEDHAERACLCALAMQRKIHELQLGWAARGLPNVSARAGLNTAGVVVGYMGSNKAQMNFTCMGDGVNLASRLEGANKEYGTAMMVSDATYQRAKNKVTARFLDFLAVKGKKEPVKVYELVCEKGKEPPDWEELHQMYDNAIQLHLDRKWDEAIAAFEQILARWPDDGPSATYLHRCHEYIQNPPPEGWDGRYILTHK